MKRLLDKPHTGIVALWYVSVCDQIAVKNISDNAASATLVWFLFGLNPYVS